MWCIPETLDVKIFFFSPILCYFKSAMTLVDAICICTLHWAWKKYKINKRSMYAAVWGYLTINKQHKTIEIVCCLKIDG